VFNRFGENGEDDDDDDLGERIIVGITVLENNSKRIGGRLSNLFRYRHSIVSAKLISLVFKVDLFNFQFGGYFSNFSIKKR